MKTQRQPKKKRSLCIFHRVQHVTQRRLRVVLARSGQNFLA